MLTNTSHDGGLNSTQDFFSPNGGVAANLLFTPTLTQIAASNFDTAAGGFSASLSWAGSAVTGGSPDAVGAVAIGQTSTANGAPSTPLTTFGAAGQPVVTGQSFTANAIQPQATSTQAATPDYTITQTTDGSGNQVTTYAMNAGGSVQITDFANSTQVVVTGSVAGDTQTYNLGANAQINFGENGTLAATSANNQIFIGGTGETLNISGAGTSNLLIALGAGVQINQTSGEASPIALANANATVNAQTDSIWMARGESASISGNITKTITLGGSDTVSLNGGNQTVNSLGGLDNLTIGGVGSGVTVNGSNETITLTGQVNLTVNGASESVNAQNGGANVTLENTIGNLGADRVTIDGNFLFINDGAQTNYVTGSGNIIFDQSNENLTLSNASNTGANVNLNSANLTGNTINLVGQNDWIDVTGGGFTINVNGTGEQIQLNRNSGNWDTVNASNTSIQINYGDVEVSVNGSNNTFLLNHNVQATIYGGGNYQVIEPPNFTITSSASFLANQQELYRIYQAVLGRAPDADGFQYWVNQLQNGVSDSSIVAGFMGSSEFQAKYGALNNTQFVTALYQNVLGRQPDASGLQYWVNSLNGGLARPQLVLTFANSTEFESNSAAAAQAYITGSRFASLSANSAQQLGDIYRLYEAGLGRAPDAGGLNYWSYQIQNGTPESSIAQGFVNSPEFQQLYPTSETNTDFVTALYQNILGRQPDSAGLQYWVNQLNSGMSRAQLLTTLSDSAEYQSNTGAAETEFMNGALYGYWQT